MSTAFNSLKKSRKDSLTSLNKELNKISNPEKSWDNVDDRYWRPELDKSGNGYAVIRFLPAPEGEDLPWVRVWNHGFQGPGGWYIENSLTTLNQPDPCSEYNSQLWNSGIEANKEIARKQKRRLTYTSNVYVITDSKHPEHEGKIFLYRYGKKIFDKINDIMNPQFEDENPVNPFDFWEGSNFKLKVRKVDGFSNYDKSEFESSSKFLEGDDDKLEALWKTEHKLLEFIEPKNFKTYNELKQKLDRVLGQTISTSTAVEVSQENEDLPFDGGTAFTTPEVTTVATTSDDTEDMSYFEKLANDE
jgi:hypothetical protein